jgi:hypothetical protein
MLGTKRIALIAAVAAVGLPATAHAATASRVAGVVIAKDQTRGSFVLAGRAGVATTVRAPHAHPRLGDRLVVSGPRLRSGLVQARALRVVGHVRRTSLRAVVVRQLKRQTLVSAGGSIVAIRRASSARVLSMSSDDSGLKPGTVARFGLSISSTGVVQTAATPLGVTSTVKIEGVVVTVSPLVVSVKGLPVTITVPAGMSLPTGLAPGADVELTVSVADGNAFTLVSFDDQVADQPEAGDDDQHAGDDDQGEDASEPADDDSGSSDSGSTGGSGPGGDDGGSGGDD